MGNVDWGCLAVQVAITGVAFYLVNMLILFKDVEGKAPSIKRDDMNLFLSLLLAILVGYWATTYVKPDCVSVPYTKQEGKEKFDPFNFGSKGDWANFGRQIADGNNWANAGNQIEKDFQNFGGQIASGAQNTANTVGDWFSRTFR